MESWREELKVDIHDCYYDINNKEPNNELIINLFNNLPNDIKSLAKKWGGFDIEVRDEVYKWILYLKNKEAYENYSNSGVYDINWSEKLETKEMHKLLDEED